MILCEIVQNLTNVLKTYDSVSAISAQGYHILLTMCDGSRCVLKVQNMPSESKKSKKRTQILNSIAN